MTRNELREELELATRLGARFDVESAMLKLDPVLAKARAYDRMMASAGVPEDDELVDLLGNLEHEQWAHWTRHFLEVLNEVIGLGFYEARGAGVNTPGVRKAREALDRWKRQIKTPYVELSEAEKESDREWARRVLTALRTRIFVG